MHSNFLQLIMVQELKLFHYIFFLKLAEIH